MSTPLIPEPSDWYYRARSAEPRLQDARAAELRQRGVPRGDADRIVAAESDQREFEREERVASRHPARFFGDDSPQARQTFRERATEARRTITRSRERFAGQMRQGFPGWEPPVRAARSRTAPGRTSRSR